MAKKSSVNKNERRRKMVARFAERRATLKKTANDQSLSLEDRFQARLKLAALPRNSAAVRIRNRCEVTGRPRGTYRKFKMSRIALRELGSQGMIPGLVKSSW
jgi:small subunit ribosomal protein S14